MTDVLSDVLDTVALKAAIYFRTDFHPEFGIAVPAYGRAARFHLVVQGSCYVTLESGRQVRLQPGDLALVPNGSAHLLSSSEAAPGSPLADVMSQAGFTGSGPFVVGEGPDGASCQMVCGHFTFADGADHPLLRSIPDVLHITAADRARRPMLDDVLRLLVRRMFEGEPGAAATVSRLSEVLFVEALAIGPPPPSPGLSPSGSDVLRRSAARTCELAILRGCQFQTWGFVGRHSPGVGDKCPLGLESGPMRIVRTQTFPGASSKGSWTSQRRQADSVSLIA